MGRKRKNHQNFGEISGLKITSHAHQQMKSRSISKKEIKKALSTGTTTDGNEPGTTHIISPDGIMVVANLIEGIIITVVRVNFKEEKNFPLKSKLKKMPITEKINKIKTPKVQLNKQKSGEVVYEISLEDYLNRESKK